MEVVNIDCASAESDEDKCEQGRNSPAMRIDGGSHVPVQKCRSRSIYQPCQLPACLNQPHEQQQRADNNTTCVQGCVHRPYFIEHEVHCMQDMLKFWFVDPIQAIRTLVQYCDEGHFAMGYIPGGREMMLDFCDFILDIPPEGVPSFPEHWGASQRIAFNKLRLIRDSAFNNRKRCAGLDLIWGEKTSPTQNQVRVNHIQNNSDIPADVPVLCSSLHLLRMFPWDSHVADAPGQKTCPLGERVAFGTYYKLEKTIPHFHGDW